MFSQYNIEPLLDEFLPEQGFFLEIGAWDGEHFSQSLYLERKGWKGLCVDPFLRNFDGRTCELCPKAISSNGLPREFIRVTTDRRHGGDVSYLSGFRDSIRIHLPTIQEHCEYQVISVDTITIVDLYEFYELPRYIDFLSIDVEGAEIEVFSGINFDQNRFGLITFEHNGDESARRHIGALLIAHGYERVPVIELKWDDVYTNRDLLW